VPRHGPCGTGRSFWVGGRYPNRILVHHGRVARLWSFVRTGCARRGQIEVNLFGALWVTRAALPILREQGSGWIVQVSSIGGLAAFPLTGIYHASKWALEGLPRDTAPRGRAVRRQGIDGRAQRLPHRLGRAPPWTAPSLSPHMRGSRRSQSAARPSKRRTTDPNQGIPISPLRRFSIRSSSTRIPRRAVELSRSVWRVAS